MPNRRLRPIASIILAFATGLVSFLRAGFILIITVIPGLHFLAEVTASHS